MDARKCTEGGPKMGGAKSHAKSMVNMPVKHAKSHRHDGPPDDFWTQDIRLLLDQATILRQYDSMAAVPSGKPGHDRRHTIFHRALRKMQTRGNLAVARTRCD